MESALAWIGQIAQWVGQWFPRWETLDMATGALKTRGSFFRAGVTLIPCGPGLHWWWPATTKWETYPVAFQTDNLPSQTVETADGQSVTVGGMISYRVADIQKLITECHSPVMAIRTVTLPAIHQVACRMEWEKLKEEQRRGTLDTKLRNAVKVRLETFGISVDSVELTDMTEVVSLRLIQSTQSDIE